MLIRKVETITSEHDIDELGSSSEISGPISSVSFLIYEEHAPNGPFWRSLGETESIVISLIMKADPTISQSYRELLPIIKRYY